VIRWCGPNPNLGTIEKGPFAAVQVVTGDLGTKGGLLSDEYARVLREDGSVIDGLYVSGNNSASVMGRTYPGPGSTLGPGCRLRLHRRQAHRIELRGLEMDIQGKVFVVTGGGNGIGREVVLGLLGRGARVAAVDLSADGLAGTVSLAGPNVDRLTTHQVNVTDAEAVNALPQAVVDAHGSVDGLLNVAGIIQKFVPFAELATSDIERVMNVNFWGPVNMVRAFLPHLVKRPTSAIVNVVHHGRLPPRTGPDDLWSL